MFVELWKANNGELWQFNINEGTCRHLNKMEMGIEEREAKKSSGLATLVSYHTRTLSLHMNT